jgi:hypothetical protein
MDSNSTLRIANVQNKTLQFADNTLIIMDAHPTTLTTIMETLHLYASIVSLQINSQKSEFIPIAVPRDLHNTIARLLDCQHSSFPMKYLGLPLSIKKLWNEDYLPIITKHYLPISSVHGELQWTNNMALGDARTLLHQLGICFPIAHGCHR